MYPKERVLKLWTYIHTYIHTYKQCKRRRRNKRNAHKVLVTVKLAIPVRMNVFISGSISARVAKFGDDMSYYGAQVQCALEFGHSLKHTQKIHINAILLVI